MFKFCGINHWKRELRLQLIANNFLNLQLSPYIFKNFILNFITNIPK